MEYVVIALSVLVAVQGILMHTRKENHDERTREAENQARRDAFTTARDGFQVGLQLLQQHSIAAHRVAEENNPRTKAEPCETKQSQG